MIVGNGVQWHLLLPITHHCYIRINWQQKMCGEHEIYSRITMQKKKMNCNEKTGASHFSVSVCHRPKREWWVAWEIIIVSLTSIMSRVLSRFDYSETVRVVNVPSVNAGCAHLLLCVFHDCGHFSILRKVDEIEIVMQCNGDQNYYRIFVLFNHFARFKWSN